MDYDYVIVGSGGAGLLAALLARRYGRVLVVTKDNRTECNTNYAQGGIAAAIGPNDSPEQHLADTLVAGAGLCHEDAVRVLVTEGPERVRELAAMGLPFDCDGATLALGQEGAHGRPRILHAGGDATGRLMELTLDRVVQEAGIEVRDHAMVTELLLERGVAAGVRLLDEQTGRLTDISARFVILATGGAGQLFAYTTNPAVATGDGLALAYRAGAELADLEFYQFHPTALSLPGAPSFLISEAVRGAGAILRNAEGAAFMRRYDQRAELAPRDIVARAIVQEMAETGRPVSLDLRHLPATEVRAHFPTITAFCARYGVDLATALVPVAPAAHYFMGGIVTDLWGETTIPNLFAAGECARSGIHGANRLASNSMLELLVFGHRVVERTRMPHHDRQVTPPGLPARALSLPEAGARGRTIPVPSRVGCTAGAPTHNDLRRLLWTNAGIVRHADGLDSARRQLGEWEQTLPASTTRAQHELAGMILVGRLLVEAALARQESRGAHARSDFPATTDEWRCHLVFNSQQAGRIGDAGWHRRDIAPSRQAAPAIPRSVSAVGRQ